MDKLFIGIPHQDVTTIEWGVALRLMEIPCPYLISMVKGYPIHVAREEIVKDAKEADASHLFFLDSDVILPRNALEILASHEYPVVSALYPSKQGVWCCYKKNGNGTHLPIKEAKDKVLSADSVGLGACLIDMRVFDKIDPPYFGWTYTSEGGKSEDILFCEKLEENGFGVLLDGRVTAKHVYVGAITAPDKVETLTV